MIYVPMLKTRKEEYDVMSKMRDCFSEKIIPLIEIISDKYQVRYKINPETGEYIYKQGNKKRIRVKDTPTKDDCITLTNINEILNGRKVFIDYFRFSNKVYGNDVDISRAELAWRISNDPELYKNKIEEVTNYPNMIPVISIKNSFRMGKNELSDFIINIQKKSASLALRITEEWIEEYRTIIKTLLRSEDYLLFDVSEQNPRLKFMEIEEVLEIGGSASVILLNSPRKRKTNNADFPAHGTTNLINNCAREIAEEHNIDGYGDYCGLKDSMPRKGSNGRGAALSLFYDFEKNIFYSYSNHNKSLGMRGYIALIPIIISDKAILDPQNDCPSYKKVKQMSGCGNWGTWHNINATRYIYQTYKYL